MNFQLREDWVVHFIEADCKTTIGPRTRYIHFATEQELRAFVSRCNLEDPAGFEHSLGQWSRGSTYATLTDEQYSRLKFGYTSPSHRRNTVSTQGTGRTADFRDAKRPMTSRAAFPRVVPLFLAPFRKRRPPIS
jgi:hypothetical protein